MARIYLVDDHVILREALGALLSSTGHAVVGQSHEPGAALADIRALQPEVLLVDLDLGLRSGFELLADIKRRGLSLKTIVMTMSTRPSDVAQALRSGADGYVLKASEGSELMRAIETVLKGGRFYEGQVADLAVKALTMRDDESVLAALSIRERQVIFMVVNGKSSTQIGHELSLSAKTVDTYRSRLMAKVGAAGVPELVRFALRSGLLSSKDL